MTAKQAFSAIILAGLCVGTSGMARIRNTATEAATNQALDPVIACHSIVPAAERLACYDSNVGALQAAAAKHDIVVVDQAEVAKVRHSLFGFSVPSLNLFGAEKSSAVAPEEREITATIAAARQDGDGDWILTMQDGMIWHQTGGTLALAPRPGGAVTIVRAALGSYFMRVGHQPGVKARREG